MNRTLRAVLLAALIGFASVAGFGWLLGFPSGAAAVAGAVAALTMGGLVLAAAARSGTLRDQPPPD